MLDDLKFVSNKDPHDELGVIERGWRDKFSLLNEAAVSWRADKKTDENLAKQIAEYCAGKSVVIYGSSQETVDVWYQNIALRAQARAFSFVLGSENNTEISAWRSQPVDKLFAVIILRDKNDSSEVNEAIEGMKKKLSGLWPHPMEVSLKGKSKQQISAWNNFLAELSAAYLAVLHSVSPKKS